MLSIILAIIIWGILGFAYILYRNLGKFDIPICIWILIGLFLEYYVCATGIGF